MSESVRVLFVCLGNICRSPSAEGVFQHMLNQRGLADRISCDSAGTSAYHEGEPADHRMQLHAQKRGYRLDSIARGVKYPQDFEQFDYIVAMDRSNLTNLKKMDVDSQYGEKLVMMTDFCNSSDEVPDPYFGGAEGFELVLDILEDSLEEFLSWLSEKYRL